jgi:hypothetical protein
MLFPVNFIQRHPKTTALKQRQFLSDRPPHSAPRNRALASPFQQPHQSKPETPQSKSQSRYLREWQRAPGCASNVSRSPQAEVYERTPNASPDARHKRSADRQHKHRNSEETVAGKEGGRAALRTPGLTGALRRSLPSIGPTASKGEALSLLHELERSGNTGDKALEHLERDLGALGSCSLDD